MTRPDLSQELGCVPKHKQMNEIVFASHNQHKIEEIRAILGPDFVLKGLSDIGCYEVIPEPYDTLEENALAKARHVTDHHNMDCFADDTGLEVEALHGMPGVYSARYAGPEKDSIKNMQKLLKELQGSQNRRARFRTVIALVLQGSSYFFEGIVEGRIDHEAKGKQGFGYDPVFIPDGYTMSFAEMPAKEKNRISHRKRAMDKLINFLKGQLPAG